MGVALGRGLPLLMTIVTVSPGIADRVDWDATVPGGRSESDVSRFTRNPARSRVSAAVFSPCPTTLGTGVPAPVT